MASYQGQEAAKRENIAEVGELACSNFAPALEHSCCFDGTCTIYRSDQTYLGTVFAFVSSIAGMTPHLTHATGSSPPYIASSDVHHSSPTAAGFGSMGPMLFNPGTKQCCSTRYKSVTPLLQVVQYVYPGTKHLGNLILYPRSGEHHDKYYHARGVSLIAGRRHVLHKIALHS